MVSNMLNEVKFSIKDFISLPIDDCVYIKKSVYNNNEEYTIVGLWEGIVKLEQILFDSRSYILSLTGAKLSDSDFNKDTKAYRIYKGENYDRNYVSLLKMRASTAIMHYKMWLEMRERLLNGSVGAFFDFEELSSIIADICSLCDVNSYLMLYNVLQNIVVPWSSANDSVIQFLRDVGVNLDNNMNKNFAYNDLKRSRSFTVTSLAFIMVKLDGMLEIENKIEELKDFYFTGVVQDVSGELE